MRVTKRLTGAVVAASVLASITGVGAAHAASTTEATAIVTSAVTPQEDGRSIAEAVLFGSGAYGDAISEIPALSASQQVAEGNESAEAQEIITAVLDAIESSEPGIYEDVHASFRSGDPYAVEASLTSLSDAAHVALAEYAESTTTGEGKADVTPNAVVAVIALVIHVVTAVTAANAAVFVNAVAGANVLWTENWAPSPNSGERPAELIGDLAEAFAE